MTIYYVDSNRGSDSNAGTSSAAPKATFSFLASTVLASGDAVLLADDSEWVQTAHTNIASGWGGTKQSPVTIGKYSPLSASNSKPRISYRRSIAANEWTYDATAKGWYWQWHASVGTLRMGYIKFGGQWGYATTSTMTFPLPQEDGAWRDGDGTVGTSGRIYVYAPSTVNPTDYYGSVEFAPHAVGVFNFNSTGTFVIVEDIAASEAGPLVSISSSSGTRRYLVRRNDFDDVGACVRLRTSTAGAASLEVTENSFSRGGTSYITTDAGSGLGFGGLLVHRNRFRGGNIAYSQGNVYMQARGAPSIVAFNEFDGAAWGAGYTTLDGCAVYAEVGSNDVVVVGNVVRNTYCPFQDNSGRKTTWMGNLAIDGNAFMKCTDMQSVGASNHRFWNNTGVRLGAPVQTLSGQGVGGIGWYGYQDLACDLRNNLFTLHPRASAQPAIEVGTGATGTISHNCQHGFSSMVAAYNGDASPITASSSVEQDPLLDASHRLTALSPCRGAGVYIPGAKHYGGIPMSASSPDIGARPYQTARQIELTRAIAG